MKKLISSVAVTLLAVSAFAQNGTVEFQNNAVSLFYLYTDLVTDKVTSAPLDTQDPVYGGPGVLDVGLFWSTSQFNTVGGGTLAGIENISSTAGLLNGNNQFQIPGTSANEEVFLQVFAWDGSYGNSAAGLQACINAGSFFGAASAGDANYIYGEIGSALQIQLGATVGPGTPMFGSAENEYGQTIMLASNPYVPEPGILALSGLGTAALLFFRRRK